jgi:tRNA(Ile)-lysidine synthase
MIFGVSIKRSPSIEVDTSLLRPGLRLAVGVSGGADSVALLRALAERSRELGLVLHVAHLHHGLRGAEADADRDFCRELAEKLGLPFHEAQVDTAAAAIPDPAIGKAAETIEEAARRLRYGWFRELMGKGIADAVATAHTLDDQAETVLAKFLRGAWTEGLSGIHPVVRFPEGSVVRPFLAVTRVGIEAYLRTLGQRWREDSSNRHMTFTRNRIRHELLPLLEQWNPCLREHLAQMAELAREEEAWWQSELSRIDGQIVLEGRPVRGGGRVSGEGLAIEAARLGELPVALQRRVLRRAAERLGATLDFEATEALRMLALTGRGGQKCELAGLIGERTHREMRLNPGGAGASRSVTDDQYVIEIPGEVEARQWGILVQIRWSGAYGEESPSGANAHPLSAGLSGSTEAVPVENNSSTRIIRSVPGARAVLRSWRPGDRVLLRHSGSRRKVKEVLERMHVTGSARANWPVLELNGRIIWMQGVQLEPGSGVLISIKPLVPNP